MKMEKSLAATGAIFLATYWASAQQQKPKLERAPAPVTSPASGKEMFDSYCASCHGKSGKGDGPAAAALKATPADLTMLAKQNGGKYPDAKVASILRGQTKLIPHGDQEMPIWGPVFWRISQGNDAEYQQRIANVNRYLESLQAK